MSKLFSRSIVINLRGSILCPVVTCLALAAASTLSFGQAGQLDTTFANQGIFSDNFRGATGFATAVALQTDGKIVVAGESGNFTGSTDSRGVVLRLNPNGTLDAGFGSGGSVSIRFGDFENKAVGLAIQTDGRIVVSGFAGIGDSDLVRLNTNGSFDTSFGNGGFALVSGQPGALVLQSNGEIVVLESSGNTVQMQRFETNGQLDTTFGTDGTAALVFGGDAIALLSNGKFLASSGGFEAGAVVRYNSNGSLDTTFGISGQQSALAAPGLAVQSNGQIVTAGSIVTRRL